MSQFPRNARTGQTHRKFGRKYVYSETTETWSPIVPLASAAEARRTAAVASSATTFYATAAELPLSNNTTGALAFVNETNRLYVWSGTGWYNVATISGAGASISGAEQTYDFAWDGTPIVITLTQSGLTSPTWSYEITSGSVGRTATISLVGNVCTITPSTNVAHNNSFGITFTATDGSNTIVADSQFTLTIIPYSWQGRSYGYAFGGSSTNRNVGTNTIQKFDFASITPSVDVGTLTKNYTYSGGVGTRSTEHAYINHGSTAETTTYAHSNEIIKRAWAGDTNFALVGNLVNSTMQVSSHSSETHGYASGGWATTAPIPSGRVFGDIQKYPFASDTNASIVAQLFKKVRGSFSNQSEINAYVVMGDYGFPPDAPNYNRIQRFPFAVDENTVVVGTVSPGRLNGGSSNSTTHGYNAGGSGGASFTQLSKWPFASDTDTAATIGSITNYVDPAAISSTDYGYSAGGWSPTLMHTNIYAYPFASDVSATSVGNLVSARSDATGSQV